MPAKVTHKELRRTIWSTGIGFNLPNTGQIKRIVYGTATEKIAQIEQWSSKPKQREALIQRRSKYFIKDVDASGDKPVVILELVE